MSYLSPEEFELLRLVRNLGGAAKVKELLESMKNNSIKVDMLNDYLRGIGYKVPSPLEHKIKELEGRISVLEGKTRYSPSNRNGTKTNETKPLLEEMTDGHLKARTQQKMVEIGLTSEKNVKRATKGTVTPIEEYNLPILEALIESGGSGKVSDVLDKVFNKIRNRLKPTDFEKLPSGTSVRWRNKAQWARNKLKIEGNLNKESPDGIWEITDKGRKLYETLKEEKSAR